MPGGEVKVGARVEAVVCLEDRKTGKVECYGGESVDVVDDKAGNS